MFRYEIANGVLLFEKGVLLFEKGVLLFEKGVLLFEKGVLLFEKGVLLFEKGRELSHPGKIILYRPVKYKYTINDKYFFLIRSIIIMACWKKDPNVSCPH
jgi:hypothetical protein